MTDPDGPQGTGGQRSPSAPPTPWPQWQQWAQRPLYQQGLKRLLQNPDPNTTAQLLHELTLAAFEAGQVGQGDRPPSATPIPATPSQPTGSLQRSPQSPTELAPQPHNFSLDTELQEMEQCVPESVGIWNAAAPPAVAGPLANPLDNPFDAPELLGQILIDVPHKIAQPTLWNRRPGDRPSPNPNSNPNSTPDKLPHKLTHHHHHFHLAQPGVNRAQAMNHSDRVSQGKEFYDSESAVFPRSVVPAIAPELTPEQEQWNTHVAELGQRFRQERRRRGMSLATLSSRTYIPLPHLISLEQGTITQLPQPIYVHGFIKCLAKDLALDVDAILDELPPLPTPSAVPAWIKNQSPKSVPLTLQSWHLYLGYSAVLAGSLAWVTQDLQGAPVPTPTSENPSQEILTPETSQAPSAADMEAQIDQELSSFAPPEAIQP